MCVVKGCMKVWIWNNWWFVWRDGWMNVGYLMFGIEEYVEFMKLYERLG